MDRLTTPPENHIFVFGSNLAGRHGIGAALDALRFFGATYGNGVGPQNTSYAIPTKNHQLKTLPLPVIHERIDTFISYAILRQDLTFILTPIGTGLAGIPVSIMRSTLPQTLPENVILHNWS